MTVLDRSWYGRVLVERVRGLASEAEWTRAYDDIAAFERMLAGDGAVIVKLWLEISDGGAAQALREAQTRPAAAVEADGRGLAQPRAAAAVRGGGRGDARAHRPAGCAVAADPGRVEGTSRACAVIETVIAAVEAGMRAHGIEPSPTL